MAHEIEADFKEDYANEERQISFIFKRAWF